MLDNSKIEAKTQPQLDQNIHEAEFNENLSFTTYSIYDGFKKEFEPNIIGIEIKLITQDERVKLAGGVHINLSEYLKTSKQTVNLQLPLVKSPDKKSRLHLSLSIEQITEIELSEEVRKQFLLRKQQEMQNKNILPTIMEQFSSTQSNQRPSVSNELTYNNFLSIDSSSSNSFQQKQNSTTIQNQNTVQISELQVKNEKLTQILTSKNNYITELEHKLSQLHQNDEIKQLQKAIEDYQSKDINQSKEISILKHKYSDIIKKYEDSEKEVFLLQERLIIKDTEISERKNFEEQQRADTYKLNDKINQLQTNLQKYEEYNQELKEKLEEYQYQSQTKPNDDTHSYKEEIINLKKQNKEYLIEIQQIQNELISQSTTYSQNQELFQKNVAQLKQEINNLKRDIESKQQIETKNEQHINEQNIKYNKLEQDYNNLKIQYNSLITKNSTAFQNDNINQELVQENQELKQILNELKSKKPEEIEFNQMQIIKMQDTIRQLEQQKILDNNKIKELENDLLFKTDGEDNSPIPAEGQNDNSSISSNRQQQYQDMQQGNFCSNSNIEEVLALRQENIRLQEVIEQYISELNQADEVIQNLKRDIDIQQQQIDEQISTIAVKSEEILSIQTEKDLIIQELQRQIQTLTESHEQEITDLTTQNQTLQGKLDTYTGYISTYKELESTNKSLKIQIETLKEQLQLQSAIDTSNINKQTDYNKLQSDYNTLQNKYKELEDTYMVIESEYVKYKMELATAELKHDNLVEKVRKLEKSLKYKEESIRKLDSSRNDAKRDLSEVTKAIEQLGQKDILNKISEIIYRNTESK